MTWVRLDDKFPNHPKVINLSDAAFRLHVSAICYAGEYLTDGHISGRIVRNLSPISNLARAVEQLVAARLWEPTEDGYQIHDFLEYNPSAEKKKTRDADNARRQAEWRTRQGRVSNGVTNSITNGVTNCVPSRTRPHSNESSSGNRGVEGGTGGDPAAAAASLTVPERLKGFHGTLCRLKGYDPSPEFFETVLGTFSHLNLDLEAVKAVEWNRSKKRRLGTTAFVLNWLEKAARDAEMDRRNGTGTNRLGSNQGKCEGEIPGDCECGLTERSDRD